MNYWVNIDYTKKTYKIHKKECKFCNPEQSRTKGINKLKIGGGWFSFGTLEDAKEYYKSINNKINIVYCKICMSKIK